MPSSEVYADAAAIRAQTGKQSDADDDVLDVLGAAASRAIDNYCNRKEDGFKAAAAATAREYPGSGRNAVFIDECVEITLVETKSSPDASYVSWAAADWVAFRGDPGAPTYGKTPYHGVLAAQQGYSRFPHHHLPSVRVTAKWGYATATPEVVVQATTIQASRWYKRAKNAWADAIGNKELGMLMFQKQLDPDVQMLLKHGGMIRRSVG